MQREDVKSVVIIGAGRLGQAMARTALRAGRRVVIANSRGPQSLAPVVIALAMERLREPSSRPRPPPPWSSPCLGTESLAPSGDSSGTGGS